jgi:hypothetical protein
MRPLRRAVEFSHEVGGLATLGNLVRPERFELPTYCSGGNRSIHLSYGRTPRASVYTVSTLARVSRASRVVGYFDGGF